MSSSQRRALSERTRQGLHNGVWGLFGMLFAFFALWSLLAVLLIWLLPVD